MNTNFVANFTYFSISLSPSYSQCIEMKTKSLVFVVLGMLKNFKQYPYKKQKKN